MDVNLYIYTYICIYLSIYLYIYIYIFELLPEHLVEDSSTLPPNAILSRPPALHSKPAGAQMSSLRMG